MKYKAADLRKVVVDFEDGTNPPPPPTGPVPPPPPGTEPAWDEPPRIGRGEGEGPEGIPVPGGEPLPPEITDSKKEGEEAWREDVQRARQRNAGSIPGALVTILEDMFAKPVIDWKILLKRFVNKMAAKVEYFMPNKRFLGSGDILWGSKRTKEGFETLFIIADTSGSIGKNELQQFINETQNIMKEHKPKETYLIWCDATMYLPVDVLKGTGDLWKMREPRGGGGTDFRPPFKWIEENILGKKKIGPIVYFTDGFGPFPALGDYGTDKYAKNVFWVIISPNRPNNDIQVPFGTKLDLVTKV